MQSQGGKICPCDCTAQILPRGQELVKIVHYPVHDAHQKTVFPSHAAIGPPHPPILFVSPLPLHTSSPNIYPKAHGACVARGGLGRCCRPQCDITLYNPKKIFIHMFHPPFNSHITPPVLKLQFIDGQGSGGSCEEEWGGRVGATTQ